MKLIYKELITICFAVFSLALISCSVGDDESPNTVQDLAVGTSGKLLNWTSPGDDGDGGRATLYLVRFFDDQQIEELLGVNSLEGVNFSQISDEVINNFGSATQIPEFLSPSEAGSSESVSIPRIDLTGDKEIFLALRTNDEVGNSSQVSNVVQATTPLAGAVFQDSDENSCLGMSVASAEVGGRDNDDEDAINDDLIIGDPCRGRVYIFFGNSSFSGNGLNLDVSQADVTIIGDPAEQFGASVSGIGNFGGRGGFQEIVIGAPEANNGTGKIYLIFGEENFDPVINVTLGEEVDRVMNGENQGDNFGFVIKERGADNILVGAPNALNQRGKVYNIDADDLDDDVNNASSASDIMIGEAAGDQFGFDVTEAGDIDDSSPLEFAASAPGAGKVYIFFENRNLDLSEQNFSDVLVIEGNPEDGFGESISGGFNIDGLDDDDNSGDNIFLDADLDEDADLLIGAPGFNNGTGVVFLYSGNDLKDAFQDDTPLTFVSRIDGINEGDNFGSSVESLSDINPDIDVQDEDTANVLDLDTSPGDFAISAPGNGNNEVYIYFGTIGFSGNLTAADADFVVSAPEGIENFGKSICRLGDINDDSFIDFAVGSDSSMIIEF